MAVPPLFCYAGSGNEAVAMQDREGAMKPLTGLLGMVLVVMLAGGAAAQEKAPEPPKMTPEKQKICEEAEKRYQKIYGHPSGSLKKKGIVVVKMFKYTFCPPQVRVKPGTTVRWVNVDKRTSHSVWFRDTGKEESERIFPDPEEMVEMKFDGPPGEYSYLCGPHWKAEGMVGRVIVDLKAP